MSAFLIQCITHLMPWSNDEGDAKVMLEIFSLINVTNDQ